MPGRHLTDRQVRLYMNFRRKDTPSAAAAKASFSTATAYRIESDPQPPSQKQPPRSNRRSDPLEGIFEKEVVPLLVECPALRAVTIFEELRRRHRKLPASVRRTIERRVRRWRALHGPEQEVIFAQKHPPGRLVRLHRRRRPRRHYRRCAADAFAVSLPAALLGLRIC